MENKKRVALLGGSFDPVHNGHLMLAEYAKIELNLDRVIFVPCYESAYKDKIIQVLPKHRYSMLSKLSLDISWYEFIMEEAVSYTIDTVKYFVKIYPEDEIIFIAGIDTVSKFDFWKNSKEIKRLVDVKFAGIDFYVPEIEISSTLIRRLIKEGRSIKYLVPETVENYIIKNKLYV